MGLARDDARQGADRGCMSPALRSSGIARVRARWLAREGERQGCGLGSTDGQRAGWQDKFFGRGSDEPF